MFAISSPSQYTHRPFVASPLSPIHHNVRFQTQMTSTHKSMDEKSKHPVFKHVPARPHQTSDSTKSASQRRQLRNAVLLKGIKDRRQHARDALRSDSILRSDVIAEQRAMQQAYEAEAEKWSARDEDLMDEPTEEDPELEEYLRCEEEEIEALMQEDSQLQSVVTMQEQQQKQHQHQQNLQQTSIQEGYDSEDEDFDMLFLEAAEEYERSLRDRQQDMDVC